MKKKLLLTIVLGLQAVFALAQISVNVIPAYNTPCDTCVTLTASATGGTAPYTYQWYLNSLPYDTGHTISYCNKYPDSFSSDTIKLIVTDASSQQGFYMNVVYSFLSSYIDTGAIGYQYCIVTVDSATGKNLLIWEQTTTPTIAYYKIFKQNTSSVFTPIAEVPRNSLSTFIDTSSHPTQVSAAYEIALVDSCGFESDLSVQPYYNTIHLVISAGIPPAWNLSWNMTQAYPIVKYRIWRATTLNHPVLIDSVANSVFTYTDLTPPSGVLYYTIEAISSVHCNPSMKIENINSINSSSFSNVAKNGANGINEYYNNSVVNIYPNPANNNITIESTQPSTIEITNIQGQLIETLATTGNKTNIDISVLAKGMYFVKVKTEKGVESRKFVKL